MKLSQLLCAADLTDAVPDREIRSITADIGQVGQGSIYVCHRRDIAQVSRLLKEARAAGAVSVAAVGEPDIRCEDTRRMLSYSVARFYGDPHKKLRVIGVTGTNGKTTTVSMIEKILQDGGFAAKACGNIGTPMIDVFCNSGETVGVAEISSFQMETLNSLCPHIAVILNVTQDHLNRHYTMENYLSSNYNKIKRTVKNSNC